MGTPLDDVSALTWLPKLAADEIAVRGWNQGAYEHGRSGRVCMVGAVRRIPRPLAQPGDYLLAQVVFEARGYGPEWNDAAERTAQEVIDYLVANPIHDNELAAVFGPQWHEVVVLTRRAARIVRGSRGPTDPLLEDVRARARRGGLARVELAARRAKAALISQPGGTAIGLSVRHTVGFAAPTALRIEAGHAALALSARHLLKAHGKWNPRCYNALAFDGNRRRVCAYGKRTIEPLQLEGLLDEHRRITKRGSALIGWVRGRGQK